MAEPKDQKSFSERMFKNLTGAGKKATDLLKKTGATDSLINLSLGPLAGPALNENLNLSDKPGEWFGKLSAEQQHKYAKENKNSKIVEEYKRKGKMKSLTKDAVEKEDKKAEERQEEVDKKGEKKREEVKKEIPKKVEPKERRKLNIPTQRKVRPLAKDSRFKRQHKFRKGTIRGVPEISSLYDRVYASVDKNRVLAFSSNDLEDALKVLYVLFFYQSDTTKIPATIVGKAKRWKPGLDAFLAKYKVPKLYINKLYNFAIENAPFTDTVAIAVDKAGRALNDRKLKFEKDTTLSKKDLQTIKSFISFFRRQSVTASKFLDTNVSRLKDPALNKLFASSSAFVAQEDISVTTQGDAIETLTGIVKYATNKKGSTLTSEELKRLRSKNPDMAKQYSRLRSQFLNVYKNFIKAYVRKSGKSKVDYVKLYKALEKEKIAHPLQKGFDGYIDDMLQYYTKYGRKIEGRPGGQVTMNPNYDKDDSTYVFKAKTPNGEATYYTADFKADRKAKKFSVVTELEKAIPKARRKWLQDLRGKDVHKAIMAAQLELMYKYAGRSGRSGNQTAGEPTFGISTLTPAHIRRKGNGIYIKYPGKKGTIQEHSVQADTIENRRIIALIFNLVEGKDKNETIWTVKDKLVTADQTLKYLRSVSSVSNAKLHNMRHLLGTKLARDIIKKSPLKSGVSQTAAEKWYKQAMTQVGKALAHQAGGIVSPMTAITNYINPELQAQFFTNLRLRVPDWIP